MHDSLQRAGTMAQGLVQSNGGASAPASQAVADCKMLAQSIVSRRPLGQEVATPFEHVADGSGEHAPASLSAAQASHGSLASEKKPTQNCPPPLAQSTPRSPPSMHQ